MMILVNSSIAQFEKYGYINIWWHRRATRADDYTHRRIVVTM